jgi:transposase InsO family protein
MMYPLVLDLADDNIPVAVTCRVLGFSKQAFYRWKANPVTPRDWDDAHLINAAHDIHHDDPEFGYRFITDELPGRGIVASRNRVNRFVHHGADLQYHSKKRGTGRKPGPPVHDDLVLREFTAAAPNLLWLTDITVRLQRPPHPGAATMAARLQPPPAPLSPRRTPTHQRVTNVPSCDT